jgi:prepilin-type N-terminal cleavage/methylation domain-containing protein
MVRPGQARLRGPRRRGDGGGFTLIELLVVMAILLILSGIIATTVLAFQRMMRKKAAGVDIKTFTMGLAAYKKDFGEYPPNDITALGATTEYGLNETIYYYLGLRHQKGVNFYGPYVTFKRKRLRDDDHDNFMEYLDTFGTYYEYALNSSGDYDIVSPGPDGQLGGTIDAIDGYEPNDEDPLGIDDVTQRSE